MALKDKDKPVARAKDYDVLKKPVITEKSSIVGGDGSVVVFRVADKAGKQDIKEAVERVFEVEVEKIRTCRFLGKKKRVNRSIGRQAGYKKAYVTLKEGHSIDFVEGL